MSAQYFDTVETLAAKRAALEAKAPEYVAEVLAHCADADAMEVERRWTGRTPVQFVRREIVSLCRCACSWAYADGSCVFGGEASEHAKAMRACLIAELNVWRAAYRKLQRL